MVGFFFRESNKIISSKVGSTSKIIFGEGMAYPSTTYGFITSNTTCVTIVEKERLTLPQHMVSSPVTPHDETICCGKVSHSFSTIVTHVVLLVMKPYAVEG
jgi:hypothetical protein